MENYGTPAPATGNKKLVALMCYCGMMWVIGLLADEYKDDPFVKKHVNAGIQLTFSIFCSYFSKYYSNSWTDCFLYCNDCFIDFLYHGNR